MCKELSQSCLTVTFNTLITIAWKQAHWNWGGGSNPSENQQSWVPTAGTNGVKPISQLSLIMGLQNSQHFESKFRGIVIVISCQYHFFGLKPMSQLLYIVVHEILSLSIICIQHAIS